MNTGIEKRRHCRIPLWWPVVLMSPNGPIMGTLRNISVSGALISCSDSEPFANNNDLLVILKAPNGREMPITCKKVWSNKELSESLEYDKIGFIFTKITGKIRDFLASLIANYSPSNI